MSDEIIDVAVTDSDILVPPDEESEAPDIESNPTVLKKRVKKSPFTARSIRQAIIYSEVLGTPKARRR